MMTVAELIEVLKKYDENMEVRAAVDFAGDLILSENDIKPHKFSDGTAVLYISDYHEEQD